jgi:hypothetical protein
MSKYRYRLPVAILFFKYGFTIYLQQPRFRIERRPKTDAEDSMLIYIGMFDDDP